MGSFFIHVLTLLHRNMVKFQVLCGDIEMAKRRLGQARIIFKLGNVIIYHILLASKPKLFKLA